MQSLLSFIILDTIMKKIVIIGGCAAGPKTAAKAKRVNPENKIELYTMENMISYSACGMPYYIKGAVPSYQNLIIRTPEDFKNQGIDVFLNHKCTQILPDEKSVVFNTIENGVGETKKVNYDELVLCVGSRPYTPKIKNMNLENIYHLKVLEDGIKIKEKMEKSKSAIILGGGYIAIEILEAFIKNGLDVTVVERNHEIMTQFDPEISTLIKDYIVKRDGKHVNFVMNDEIIEFIGTKEFTGAVTRNGKILHADFCVVAAGVVPNTELAREAGITIGITGGIRVDNRMRTNIEHIWAAGDCTEETCMITKKPMYAALGTIANKQGRIVGINLNTDTNGVYEAFDGILGSAVTSYFDFSMSTTGLTESKAKIYAQHTNIEPIATTVTKRDKPGYMPDSNSITVKLVADKRTGELLGAQAVGVGDADKRIYTVTSALRANLTVQEFLHLDLTYSPAFSSTIDPLLTAAYKLKDEIDK